MGSAQLVQPPIYTHWIVIMNRFLPYRLLPGIVMFGISTLLLLAPASFAEEVWIDVRSPQEFSSTHVDGAINIEFDSTPFKSLLANPPKPKYLKPFEFIPAKFPKSL